MTPAADGTDQKRSRTEHPSGWLTLTRNESVPYVIDALLDLRPIGRSTRLNWPSSPA